MTDNMTKTDELMALIRNTLPKHWQEVVAPAIATALAEARAEERNWRETVDDMLTVLHMTASNDPRESVNRLIDWHVRIALDPAVSSDAAALIGNERERCAKVCERTAEDENLLGMVAAGKCAAAIRKGPTP